MACHCASVVVGDGAVVVAVAVSVGKDQAHLAAAKAAALLQPVTVVAAVAVPKARRSTAHKGLGQAYRLRYAS